MLHELPTITLKIKGKKYNLWVAHDSKSKKQGLAGIDGIGDNEGMVFPYDDDRPRRFQFRETLIPLTIYFIDATGRVIQKSFSEPMQKKDIVCKKPCRWVIEVLNI